MNQPVPKGIDWTIVQPKRESALEHFLSSRSWDLNTFKALALGVLSLAIPFFVMYRGFFGMMDPRIERSIIICLLLLYIFLRFPSGKKKWNEGFSWFFTIDLLLLLLVIATEIYTIWDQHIHATEGISVQIFGNAVRLDHIIGVIVVILVLEGTRRSFGWVMVIVSLFFVSYSLVANIFPGPLKGARASWTYMMEMLYALDEGVYGIGANVLLSMIFVYLFFGSLLVGTKLGAFFAALANALVGRYSGGPAKVAVIGSGFVGSISGSGIANVAITGSVTIPMMKRLGYTPTFAAAVETVASTGGYFTPPIMGAAAFLIAFFTDTPYLKVCLYTLLPATLYYLAIFVQIHLRAKKEGLVGLPRDELPSLRQVIMEGGHLVLPIVVLVAGLAMGYSVTRVAIWGILAVILVSFLRKETRQNPRSLLLLIERATDTAVGISMAVIVCGIIQGSLMTSGLGMKLSMIVQALSAGNLILGLILAAIVTMILGMGVNPMLVYYIAYIFVIPALLEAGAPVMPTHIFALMYGAVANITPPVAVAAYTAATIAGAPAMKTGFEAAKLGFAAYIIPFMLVLHPALLLLGDVSLLESVLSMLTAAAGLTCMAASFEGWLLRRASILQRILLFAAGVCLVAPELWPWGGIGIGLLAVVTLWQKYQLGYAK